MDDDSTQKTLDVLGDLYLTGTKQTPAEAGPEPARAMANQLDGPAPLRFPKAEGEPRTLPMRGVAQRLAPTARAQGHARVEAVFLGNLPGFGGPWLTQYAHHLADQLGPVGILHVDHEQIDLELIGTPAQRQAMDDLAKAGNVPVSQGLIAALSALTRPRLPEIGAWLVHLPIPLNDTSMTIAPDLPRWTMICSSDQTAVVGAYRWAKQLLEEEDQSDVPRRLGLMVMGCDDDAARATAGRLDETAGSHLQTPIELIGSRKQMVPVELRSVGSFEAGPGLWPRVADFLETQAEPLEDIDHASDDPVVVEEEVPPQIADVVEEVQPQEEETVHALILPDEMRVRDGDADEDTVDMQPDEVLVADEVEALTAPDEAEQAEAVVPAPPDPEDEPIHSTAMNSSVAQFVERLKHAQPKQQAAEPVVVQSTPAQPAIPEEPTAQPQPPQPEPAVASLPAPEPQPVAAAAPNLIQFLPASQRGVAMPARCPHHPAVQLMLDGDGRLCLMLRNDSNDRPFTAALRELEQTRNWARDHAAILQLTMPGQKFDPHSRPIIHLFSDDARAAAAHVSQVGPDVRLHLLQQVRVGAAATWFCTPIN